MSNDLNLNSLPTKIQVAALELASQSTLSGLVDVQEERKQRQELNLWLAPSWKKMENLGMNEFCYASFVRLNMWNVSNASHLFEELKELFIIAGNDSWKIAACSLSAEEARQQIEDNGQQDFMEGLEAVLALKNMGL